MKQKDQSDWWEVPPTVKDVWRCTTIAHGALCAMMAGTLLMPLWSANSSITAEPYLHWAMLTLVQAVVQSTMTMWSAMGLRHAWLTVSIMVLESTTVITVKMQECGVALYQVSRVVETCLIHQHYKSQVVLCCMLVLLFT